MNQPAASSNEPSSSMAASVRPPRVDIVGPVHKAIRLAMADLLVRMGRTDFSEEAEAIAVAEELRNLLAYCEAHLRHEDGIVAPFAKTRLPGGLAAFEDHRAHEVRIAELRAQAEALVVERPELRARVGHALYLHFSVFVGDNLAHMAEEERVLMPLLQRFFDDGELRELHARVMAAVAPAERAYSAQFLYRALSGPERRGLVASAAASMPLEVVLGLIEAGRGAVPADEHYELVQLARETAGVAS